MKITQITAAMRMLAQLNTFYILTSGLN